MSHPLAYANQSLYHASILLSGWRAELTRQAAPEPQVTLAYAPGVREHLLDGYGWLLLAACRIAAATSPRTPWDDSGDSEELRRRLQLSRQCSNG